jgi:hypothetical protein
MPCTSFDNLRTESFEMFSTIRLMDFRKWDAPRDPNNYESRCEDSSTALKRTETQGANSRELHRFLSYFPLEMLSITF